MNIGGSDLSFPRLLYLHPVQFAVSRCHRASSRHCTGPIRRSPYMGKTISICTKRALWGHLQTLLSHLWRTTFYTSGVMRAFASLIRSFRWSTFCIFTPAHHGLQMSPQVKIKWGEFWRPRKPLHGTTATNPLTWKQPI